MSDAADYPDSCKEEILALMKQYDINFSGMGPSGYYLSLCDRKYFTVVSEYMAQATLKGVKDFIAKVDWDEVDRHHGPPKSPRPAALP